MNRTIKLSLKLVGLAAVLSLIPAGLGTTTGVGPAELCGAEGNCVRSAGSVCLQPDRAVWDFKPKRKEGGTD